MLLSARFEAALQYALEIHRTQNRKGSDVPYFSHLMGVAALVLEDGGDEEQAIAALLHDAPEDQGGRETLEDIRCRFGERVAEIVAGCTDTFESPKPPWRARKEQYIAHLRTASPDVRRVSLADKLHNARSILSDLIQNGASVWDRFRGGKDGTLWYYHTLTDEFNGVDADRLSPMAVELKWVVQKIDEIARKQFDSSNTRKEDGV